MRHVLYMAAVLALTACSDRGVAIDSTEPGSAPVVASASSATLPLNTSKLAAYFGTWERACTLSKRNIITIDEQPEAPDTALWTRTTISYLDHACREVAASDTQQEVLTWAATEAQRPMHDDRAAATLPVALLKAPVDLARPVVPAQRSALLAPGEDPSNVYCFEVAGISGMCHHDPDRKIRSTVQIGLYVEEDALYQATFHDGGRSYMVIARRGT